jgi:hypothetical protein
MINLILYLIVSIILLVVVTKRFIRRSYEPQNESLYLFGMLILSSICGVLIGILISMLTNNPIM